MREITEDDKADIQELIDTQLLGSLRPAALEKDILVRHAIVVVYQAAHSQGIDVVFAGGTALSQARGLIRRMSEDADFRLVVPADVRAAGKNAIRKYGSELKAAMIQALQQDGFPLEGEAMRARNGNQYLRGNFQYQAQFPPDESLRQSIKLELMAIDPVAPIDRLPTYSIVERLKMDHGIPLSERPSLPVLGIEETASDKLVGYLRRTAAYRAEANRFAYDDRLVRHLYDMHAIVQQTPDYEHLHTSLRSLLAETIRKDQETYGKEFPAFQEEPLAVLLGETERLDAPDVRERYGRFCQDLLYGEIPDFDSVVGSFRKIVADTIGRLSPAELRRTTPTTFPKLHKENLMLTNTAETSAQGSQTTDRERLRELEPLNKPLDKFAFLQERFNRDPQIQEAIQNAEKYGMTHKAAIHQAIDQNPGLQQQFQRLHDYYTRTVQPALDRHLEITSQLQDPQLRSDAEGALRARVQGMSQGAQHWPSPDTLAQPGAQASHKTGLGDLLARFLQKILDRISGRDVTAGQAQRRELSHTQQSRDGIGETLKTGIEIASAVAAPEAYVAQKAVEAGVSQAAGNRPKPGRK